MIHAVYGLGISLFFSCHRARFRVRHPPSGFQAEQHSGWWWSSGGSTAGYGVVGVLPRCAQGERCSRQTRGVRPCRRLRDLMCCCIYKPCARPAFPSARWIGVHMTTCNHGIVYEIQYVILFITVSLHSFRWNGVHMITFNHGNVYEIDCVNCLSQCTNTH